MIIYDNFIILRKPRGEAASLRYIYRANISHAAAPISYIKHAVLKRGNAVCSSTCRDTHVVCVCIWDGVDKSVPQHLSSLKVGYLYLTPNRKVEASSIPQCIAHYPCLAVSARLRPSILHPVQILRSIPLDPRIFQLSPGFWLSPTLVLH